MNWVVSELGAVWPALSGATVTVLILLGLLPTRLGDRFLDHIFQRKLDELKHENDEQLVEFKAKQARLGDRGRHSNVREYEACICAWEAFVGAYIATHASVLRFVEHPDLSKYTDEQVKSFLETTDFSAPQIAQVLQATDKNRLFVKVVEQRLIGKAAIAIDAARSTIRKQGIFIPSALELRFEAAIELAHKAYVQRYVEFDWGPGPKSGEDATAKLFSEGPKMFKELKEAVREHLLQTDPR